MLAYRIEFCASVLNHDVWCCNIGPYAGGIIAFEETYRWERKNKFNMDPNLYYDEDRHPVPEDDMKLIHALKKGKRGYYTNGNLYGFESLDFMTAWFDEDTRRQLNNYGFRCMVYETDEIFCGKRQVIFCKDNCTLVGMVDLLTLERII